MEFLAEERLLLQMLKEALYGKVHFNMDYAKDTCAEDIFSIAKNHAVLSSLYEVAKDMPLTEPQRLYLERECRQTVLQSYRLLFYTKFLVNILTERGIEVIVLKGVSTANFYPYPELRKSGDIDLLVHKDTDMERLTSILEKAGFQKIPIQHSLHHIEFIFDGGIIVEIHTSITEDFANKKINQCMKKRMNSCFETKVSDNVMGVQLPVLNKPFHAYELLLHALHHFLRTGFGLKFLCDWNILFMQDWTEEEKTIFEELASESDTKGFAETMTEACVNYLGLEKGRFAWNYDSIDIPTEEFIREVLDAQEFGTAEESRMVMLSGTGLSAYIKEFHHQMHLNFPKAGKCFLIWPILWIATLIKFLYNNRKVRKISVKQILKEAKRRGKLMEKIKKI